MADGFAGILGTGCYLPPRKVEVEQVKELKGLDPHVAGRMGTRAVHVADFDDQPSIMAVKAARAALEDARMSPTDVDLIIYSSGFLPDHLFWADYAFIQHELGADFATAFKIDQGCNGALMSLEVARSFIERGVFKTVLIVSSERWEEPHIDRWTASPFCYYSDGAGALVLGDGAPGRIMATSFFTAGTYHRTSFIMAGGTRQPLDPLLLELGWGRFDGQVASRFAWNDFADKRAFRKYFLQQTAERLRHSLEIAGLTLEDLDLVVGQNVSNMLLRLVWHKIGIEECRTTMHMAEDVGHFGSSDVIINLHKARTDGLVQDGSIVGLVSAGTGYSWGGAVVQL